MKPSYRFIFLLLVVAAAGTTRMSSAQDRLMGGVGITVFTDQNFRGKSATFRRDVPNLLPLGLNDQISSVRVGPGEQWELCEHSNYAGRCVVVSGEESDLRRNSWNDLISSLRRVDSGSPVPPPQGEPYIVLFDRVNYRGTPMNFNRPESDLNRRARSVTIGRGVWQLCEGRDFTGRCITLERSVPDLRTYNFRDRIASLRPISSEGPQPPSTGDRYIVIYDRPFYRGNPTNYNRIETDIFKLARSVTIGNGEWELCQGRNFTGRCVTLNRSVPDLRSYNIRQIASLRPIGGSDEGGSLFGRRWRLTEVNGREVRTNRAYLEFDRDARRVSGDGGCNRFAGDFEINRSDIRFSQVISTKRACVDRELQRIENEFFIGLEAATRFETRRAILRLYAGDRELLTFSSESR